MKKPIKNNTAGYTLLELSMVLIVVGIVMASFSSAYGLYLKNKAVTDTAGNVNVVMNAISNYFIQNGKYPCPARLNAKETDADYGMPTDCTNTSVAPSTVAVGNCSGGICVEERTSPITGAGAPTPNKPRVLRGAVPFRILNKPEFIAEDGYHTRLEYAVTEILTDAATYNKDHGAISVVDDQTPARSLVNNPDSIHFIVLSHGADKAGAYSNDGVPTLPCGTGMDAENCNTTPSNKKAVYRMALAASIAGANHFDDFVKYSSAIETPLWVVADAAGTNIRDAGLALQVAIGHAGSFPSSDPLSLDIATHVRADTDLHTGGLCNAAGGDCFSPSLIGGADPAMDCSNPATPFVTGITAGHVVCGSSVNIQCGAGQVMTGITVTGNIICSAPPTSCPATNVSVCAPNDDALPASTSGTAITTNMHGDSRYHQYTCTAAGTWSLTSSWGDCTCTAGSVVTHPSCNGYMNPSGSCWTGSVDVTTTTTCSPNTVTTTVDTSDCECSNCAVPDAGICSAPIPAPLTNAAAVPATLPAPVGYIGSVIYNKNWQCSSTTAGSFVNRTYISNSCACNASILPLTENGQSCAITGCDSTGANPSLAGQLPCAAGFVGGGKHVDRHKNYNCATASYDAVWTNTANTCSCSAVTQPQSVVCPTGYSGTIAQSRIFNCGSNSWGPWVNTLAGSPPSSCIPIQWVPQGSISGSGSATIGQEVYTACSPVNSTSACWAPSGSGNPYNYYTLCRCQ